MSVFGSPLQAVPIPLRFSSLTLHYKHAEEAESLKSLMTLLIIDWLSVLHMRCISAYSNQYHFGRKDLQKHHLSLILRALLSLCIWHTTYDLYGQVGAHDLYVTYDLYSTCMACLGHMICVATLGQIQYVFKLQLIKHESINRSQGRFRGEFSLAHEDSFGTVKHLAVSLENIVKILFG